MLEDMTEEMPVDKSGSEKNHIAEYLINARVYVLFGSVRLCFTLT
jgi:hypothetical protein